MLLRSLHRRSASPDLATLQLLVPPPAKGAAINWPQVQRRFGLSLPDDYQLIVERYGAGRFGSQLSVWIPDDRGDDDLFARATDAAERLEDARDAVPERLRADAGEGTLFTPWGSTTDGYFGYWHRSSRDPNRWPVLLTDLDNSWLYYDGGLASLLVDAVGTGASNGYRVEGRFTARG